MTRKHSADNEIKALVSQKSLRVIAGVQVLFCLLLSSFVGLAQEQNYKEDLLIDVNANQHLVGETIHYTVFSVSQSTGKPSTLSKYAYVQLVGKEGVIAQEKLELTSSTGSGEFFIPSKLITGRYYLLAYTRWMKNFDDYAETPLNIINPYLPYDDVISSTGNERNVKFKPVAGKITAGLKNRVALQITDENGFGIEERGRLVDSNGGLVTEVNTDRNGLGSFVFTPVDSLKYQLVLTDQNNDFLFFGLPNVSNKGMGLFVEHAEASLRIDLKASDQPLAGELQISRSNEVVYQKSLSAISKSFTINRDELPKDILTISIWNASGEKEAEQLLINNWAKEEKSLGEFNKRQAVTLAQYLERGHYNISVRKVSDLETRNHLSNKFKLPTDKSPVANSSFDYLEAQMTFYSGEQTDDSKDSVIYLPEVKSELIEGRVITTSGQAAADKTVILTIGNETFNIASAKTDANGYFLIEYLAQYGRESETHLTVYDFKEDYLIRLQDNYLTDLPDLDFSPIRLDSTMISELIERSVNSQLDNAYFTPPVDSSVSNIPPILVNSDFAISYNFDDYTRFKTLEEHFIEYIAGSRVRKGQEDAFIVSTPYLELNFYNTPLILLDGVPVDGRAMLEFSPYRIQSVDFVNTLFFLQSTPFDGVINFTTLEGNLGGFNTFKNTLNFQLDGPKKLQVNPSISSLSQSNADRIPDQRIQLLWQPGVHVTTSGDQNIRFNTSDVSGNFEVTIEGVTAGGLPVSIVRTLKVKEDSYDKE